MPVIIGFVVGILSGMLGIGGGMILIPILGLCFNITQHLAQGISLAVMIPTVLTGLVTFHRKKLINYKMAGLLSVGSIAGTLISGNYVHLIPAFVLKRIFGFFLSLIGLKMLLTTSRKMNNQKMEENNGRK